ncbi:MAG: O-antigen ligase family protein [Chloroflexi bacterium]|nr:O-antigen ligase family protein [Chloroflexota bacterium]
MDRARLDHWCEKGILGLVVAILIYGPLALGAVRTPEFLVIQGLTMGVLLLWMVRFCIRTSYRMLWPPICWAVLAFVGYAIIRYQQADLEYVAREELIRILIYAFLFLAILDNLNRQEAVQLVFFVLIFLGMGIALYAIYQFITGSERVWTFKKPPGYAGRASGTYICPNHLAGFLEMILPLGLAYTLTGRLKPTTKVCLGYACLMIVGGIGVSISRGGWVTTGLALLLLFGILIGNRDYRMPAMVLLVLLVGVGVVFAKKAYNPQKRFQKLFAEDNIGDVRFQLWKPAIHMWQDHFWLGVGPAHFDYRFPAYRPKLVQARPLRVHNDYLNCLADWGVVGTALVASAWVVLFWGIARTRKFVQRSNDLGTKPSNRSSFVLGASVGLCAILIHSAFDFNMHIPANAILAIALMALLTGHWRFATERYWFNPNWLGRILAALLCLAGVVYLGQQGIRRGREYVYLKQKARAEDDPQEQIAALLKAHEAEPNNYETMYALGELYRLQAWHYDQGLPALSEAMKWFEHGMKLNPRNAYNYLRYGMCLHWLKRHREATPYFERALERDPNNYYLVAHQGWHLVQLDDYAAAKAAFDESIRLKWWDNYIAFTYLKIVEERLNEQKNKR